ncbi:MAG TPA: efflux transporter periplasmic adaptor subunit [Planctomycetota bacterium]|nr:efflux transporter periplasmic adaptor subunit [Planctomycetota bacterium]
MKKQPRRRTIYLVAGVLVLAALAAVLILGGSGGARKDAATLFAVEEGPLTIGVSEPGTIKNRDQVILKSEVEGRAAILFLIAEGVNVKKGDLLIELDGTGIEEQRASQQITVINAEAAFIRARENLAVAKSQAESDVSKATQDLKFAELDLKKYVEGDYPEALQQADADITIATEEVKRAEEKLNWSKRLHEQRYLSAVDLQADELSFKKAKLQLDLAENRKQVLEDFSHERDLEALQSAVEQAKMALDRVTRKASADTVQAEADLRAKEQEFQRQKAKLEKLETQLKKTKIVAPIDGMVVYATTGRGGGRGDQDQPLQEGTEVRERQELIYLPTAQSMLAEIKVHETSLKKVKLGMPCRVWVDAVPNRVFVGRVAKIGVLPDAVSWWQGNPDLKVYNTEINLDDGTDLRAGMSCRAEIIVETYEKALFVPIQCVVREGKQTVVYTPSPQGPVSVPVEIGLDNNSMVRIVSGVEPGQKVLLNPPLAAAAQAPEAEGAGGPMPAPMAPKAAPGGEKPAGAEAAPGTPPNGKERRQLTPEERQKMLESLTPEQRQAWEERMKKRREAGGGDNSGGGSK